VAWPPLPYRIPQLFPDFKRQTGGNTQKNIDFSTDFQRLPGVLKTTAAEPFFRGRLKWFVYTLTEKHSVFLFYF
jgi:hypothetical protein